MKRLWILAAVLLVPPPASAADPGRLFYTPAQRSQLEQIRTAPARSPTTPPARAASPVRYDGFVTRSDGRTTRWVDGQPRPGPAPAGLKPGQIRADGRIYEPYQVLPPASKPEEHTP